MQTDVKLLKEIILFGLLAGVVLLVAGFINSDDSSSMQPIAYNHFKHVEENGMECLDCHQFAEENARASIPNTESCADCHEEAITESEAEANLLSFINDKRRIEWRQIYLVPDYAYFSHRRHVKLGKLECIVCHGDVGKMTEPITQQFVEPTMEWCMDCHEMNNVSNDCYACHR